MKHLLELRDISLRVSDTDRLKCINIKIDLGDKIALLGKSGSGKTSLIKIANGTIRPTFGNILYKGEIITKLSRKKKSQIATFWQDLRLIEELTVIQNVNCGALARHNSIWAIANLLDLVNLNQSYDCLEASFLSKRLSRRNIRELSSGQRTRVALARLLNQHSKLILADEPFSNLEPILGEKILDTLLTQCHGKKTEIANTCLISLHRPDLVEKFTRVIGIKQGEIKIDSSVNEIDKNDILNLYS